MEDHSSYTERITLDEGDVDYRGLMRPSALLRCAEHMAHRPRLGAGDGQSLLQRAADGLSGGAAGVPVPAGARHAGDRHPDHLPRKTRRGANKRVLVVRSLDGEELARVDTRL